MNDERFERLFEAARKRALIKGDDLSVRSKARREYQPPIDVLSVECIPDQWAKVHAAIANDRRSS